MKKIDRFSLLSVLTASYLFSFLLLSNQLSAQESNLKNVAKPDNAEAHYNLGNTYSKTGRYQEAVQEYKQAIRLKQDFVEAYSNLGMTYGTLKRYQDAIQAFEQAVRLKPDFAQAHFNLGIAYLAQSDTGNAREEHKILANLDTALADKLFKLINKKNRCASNIIS